MTANSTTFLACLVISVVAISIISLYTLSPSAKFAECEAISFKYIVNGILPTWLHGRNDKFGTVRELWSCADQYREQHSTFVLAVFCMLYILLQTFAIPGPIVLSILSGAMYPFIKAQILVAFCATVGASCCFMISHYVGRNRLQRMFPSMIQKFRSKIEQNRSNLFYYLLFLRITPMLPNWFVNVACPLVGVQFRYFFLATLFGLLPANAIHISTGATLNKASDTSDGPPLYQFAVLFLLQFVALLPVLFKQRLERFEHERFEKKKIG